MFCLFLKMECLWPSFHLYTERAKGLLVFRLYGKGYRLCFFQKRSNITKLVELHFKNRECRRPSYVASFLEQGMLKAFLRFVFS